MVNEFISDVCDILDIPIPIISFDTSNFTSNTMMAQCNSDGSEIYLKYNDCTNPDTFFCIAHELRHIYQMTYYEEIYFANYKSKELCSSVKEYNMQLAEIDANAFAGLVMIEFFDITPLFIGLPEDVIKIIFERIDFLSEEYLECD